MEEELQRNYGYVFEVELLMEIKAIGKFQKIDEGEIIIDIGETIKWMPLILNGAIKVMRENEDGDDLLLYFIERGDTCAMTITCCMGNVKSEIRAIAETETELIMLPVEKMQEWMHKFEGWQRFILQSYNLRMSELLESLDAIAFMKLDERLFRYLKDKAMVNHDDLIQTTHRDIAIDLNTSRVVVSRLLKKLEHENKIKLGRNNIKILSL